MPNTAAPISPRELARLLETWGATKTRPNAGHDVYVARGRRIQIPGAGRKASVTYPILRKAAAAVGAANVQTFLGGPK
jgi:hypothetical protein